MMSDPKLKEYLNELIGRYQSVLKANRLVHQGQSGLRCELKVVTECYPEGRTFETVTIFNNNAYQTFLLTPDPKPLYVGGWQDMHAHHIVDGGRLCIPGDTAAEHAHNMMFWLAVYIHYERTGMDNGWRHFDS